MKKVTWLFFVFFFFSSALYTLHTFKAKSILWGDTRYYFAFTRSLVINHNLNFDDIAFLPGVGFPNPPVYSPITNRIENKFSPGAPLLWIPAFVVGQLGSSIEVAVTHHQPIAAGYSWLTQWLVGVSTVGFSVLGSVVLFQTLRSRFGKKIALLTVAILWLTTQLFFYTSLDPFNSHSASFLFAALLFWASCRWLFSQKPLQFWQALVLGLIAGWLALIRNQDIIFCLPLGFVILSQQKTYLQNVLKATLFALAALAPLLIQLNFTHYLYGQYSSGYLLGGEGLHWFQPDFARVLLSQGNGFFFFAPIVFFLLWGLVMAARHKDLIAWVGLGSFVLAAYVIACWGPEIVGGPYGSRMFTSTLPWLGYGGAVMLKKYWADRRARRLILLLIFSCFLNNMGQTLYMLLKH